MQVFVFNPRSKEEQLQAFNERVGDFCEETPCVAVTSQVVGDQLLLTLLEVDDLPIASGPLPVVVPTIRTLSTEALEDRANMMVSQLIGKDDNPDAPIPMDFQVRERPDKPGTGWVVLVACMGITDADDDAGNVDEPLVCPHCGKTIEEENDDNPGDVQGLGDEQPGEDAPR
jgi:hypothetical protein